MAWPLKVLYFPICGQEDVHGLINGSTSKLGRTINMAPEAMDTQKGRAVDWKQKYENAQRNIRRNRGKIRELTVQRDDYKRRWQFEQKQQKCLERRYKAQELAVKSARNQVLDLVADMKRKKAAVSDDRGTLRAKIRTLQKKVHRAETTIKQAKAWEVKYHATSPHMAHLKLGQWGSYSKNIRELAQDMVSNGVPCKKVGQLAVVPSLTLFSKELLQQSFS
ncbi:hypothetical protein BDP27DRAFT_1376811 [Rhodocollybia butyracea]|uniref:Uncharacterized protein n=1 Tax=Rhodocollybia butyracea TaxID=206335 RepID=A0A9P5P4Z4_9AGAR|nr:hypothetical protein BDP27DRAFT_1376811 [Rhodocollybia butyracea]